VDIIFPSDVFYVYILASRSHQSFPIVRVSLLSCTLGSILDSMCSAIKGFDEIMDCLGF
jgi:membrane protein YqaA with SNARE-associated domain